MLGRMLQERQDRRGHEGGGVEEKRARLLWGSRERERKRKMEKKEMYTQEKQRGRDMEIESKRQRESRDRDRETSKTDREERDKKDRWGKQIDRNRNRVGEGRREILNVRC